jgi:hypothetical protein
MPLTDLPQFCRELTAPARRNKAAILLVPDLQDQQEHAARIAEATGAMRLDVLDLFQADAALAARIGGFAIDDLLDLIASHSGGENLIVVSGIEFLMAIWFTQRDPRQVKRDLCQRLELWENKPAFLLVTRHDPALATYQPTRHTAGALVLELSQTASLT